MSTFHYIGSELELFREANNWKAYFGSFLRPFLGNRVLEVGAGIGATTEHLCRGSCSEWICLEPDRQLAEEIAGRIACGRLPACCRLQVGTLANVAAQERFDAVLYIDVLEHIEDDHAELVRATHHLRPGGHLIVLVPAHNWLYTPFDRQIGHFRRYNQAMLRAALPCGRDYTRLFYLDSIGLLASLANRLLLQSSMPSRRQIHVWDRLMVPLSRPLDWLLGYRLGKSLLGIWRQPGAALVRSAA